MPVADYGELPVLLTACSVAPYTISTDTIGTAVALPNQMTIEIEFEGQEAEMISGGARRAYASVVTGATFKMSAGGIPWDVMAILTGMVLASPSTGVETLRGGVGELLPAFVFGGKLLDGGVGGDLHMGYVYAQLSKFPNWTVGEELDFLVSEMEGKITVPSTRKIPYFRKQSTATALDFTLLFA